MSLSAAATVTHTPHQTPDHLPFSDHSGRIAQLRPAAIEAMIAESMLILGMSSSEPVTLRRILREAGIAYDPATDAPDWSAERLLGTDRTLRVLSRLTSLSERTRAIRGSWTARV